MTYYTPQQTRIPVQVLGNGTTAVFLDELNDAAKKEWLDERIRVALAWWYEDPDDTPSRDDAADAFGALYDYLRQVRHERDKYGPRTCEGAHCSVCLARKATKATAKRTAAKKSRRRG